MPFEDDDEAEVIMARWFDFCVERWLTMFATGSAVVHRAIAVDDVDEVVEAIRRGDDMGCHWTWDMASASTCYHGGAARRIDLMMTGIVGEADVEWSTTLQMHFGHPHEREIRTNEGVRITGLVRMDTGEMIDIAPRMMAAA